MNFRELQTDTIRLFIEREREELQAFKGALKRSPYPVGQVALTSQGGFILHPASKSDFVRAVAIQYPLCFTSVIGYKHFILKNIAGYRRELAIMKGVSNG